MQATYGFLAGNRERGLIHDFAHKIWAFYFKVPVDTCPQFEEDIYQKIREHFFKADWHEVFDFLEAAVLYWPWRSGSNDPDELQARLNFALEEELSGFRFIDGQAVKITSAEEIASIETVVKDEKFSTVGAHMATALRHLASRPKPDLRNSIKESISAVEAMAQIVTGKKGATLGDALDRMKRSDGPIHPALRLGLEKLYGYTSDAEGIRHALMEQSSLTVADARFMLIACSAFVNYLKATMDPGLAGT